MNKRIRKTMIMFVLVIGLLTLVSCDSKEKTEYLKGSDFIGNVFQISIKDLSKKTTSTGSGFVFNKEGWFITNAHVMEDAHYAEAIFNIPNKDQGESFTYLDITYGSYYNKDKDIYIGKISNYSSIDSYYRNIPLCLDYSIGQTTYSVGYPMGAINIEINKGKVIGEWSDLYEKLYSGNSYVCSSSYIGHGSSGGILINENSEIIGITTLGWFDGETFLRGAAISAFNFQNLINKTEEDDLISIQERFYSDKKEYITLFNGIKDESNSSPNIKKEYEENGVEAYVVKVETEDASSLLTTEFEVRSDYWISVYIKCCLANGDCEAAYLCGYYKSLKDFSNFTYVWTYIYTNGNNVKVKSTNINYSPTVSLTLNNYEAECSYLPYILASDIRRAKIFFNGAYETLIKMLAKK